jgi:hypothetical protein
MSLKRILTLALGAVAIGLVASLVFIPTLKESGTYDLSGTYRFRGSFERSFTASGYLDFDWLGDISGEAAANSTPGSNHEPCDIMISGTYSPGDHWGVYNATINITPVSCPINDDKPKTLKVRITRRNEHGDLDLVSNSAPDEQLLGFAQLESPGPL